MKDINTLSKKQIISIIAIVLILVAMVGGVFLVQRQQQLKSKASGNFVQAFEIKDANGNVIQCDGSTNPPTCNTSTLDISVKVKDTVPLLP